MRTIISKHFHCLTINFKASGFSLSLPLIGEQVAQLVISHKQIEKDFSFYKFYRTIRSFFSAQSAPNARLFRTSVDFRIYWKHALPDAISSIHWHSASLGTMSFWILLFTNREPSSDLVAGSSSVCQSVSYDFPILPVSFRSIGSKWFDLQNSDLYS